MIGVDYASVDGDSRPNLAAAKAVGLGFVVVRGSYSDWIDPDFARDCDAIRAAGLPVGAYGMPNYSDGAPSAIVQAKALHAGANLVKGLDLNAWVDIEFSRGIKATGRTPAQLRAFLADYFNACDDLFGHHVGYYSSARVTDGDDTDCLNHAIDDLIEDRWPWIARYPFAAHIDPQIVAIGNLPGPPVPKAMGDTDAWTVHQGQGDAIHFAGFTSTVDVDRWHYFTASAPQGFRRRKYVALLGLAADCSNDALDVAIRTVQAKRGLAVDGVIGPATHAAVAS